MSSSLAPKHSNPAKGEDECSNAKDRIRINKTVWVSDSKVLHTQSIYNKVARIKAKGRLQLERDRLQFTHNVKWKLSPLWDIACCV